MTVRWESRRPTLQAIYLLTLLSTLVSYGCADPRRSIHDLGPTVLGPAQHRRGGITIYGTIRQLQSEPVSERSSQSRLREEGFDPRVACRHRTHVWTYNCQMMNPWRLENWGRELDKCFALIQGTQRTYDPGRGEKGLQSYSTSFHDVYDSRVRKKGKGGQPEGVMILGPKGSSKIVKKVMLPRDKDLEGRGLAVWYSRGLYDICMVSLYCPLGDRNPENQKKTEKLWNWLGMVRNSIPGRTRLVIGVDANGHVGSIRESTVEHDPRETIELHTEDDYPHIGPCGAEPENYNGTLLREAAERHDLVAVNTFDSRASGKTWYGGKGGATRVDYILMDRSSVRMDDKVILGREMHRRLRTLVSLEVMDHVPLCLHFQYRPWQPPPQKNRRI